MKDNSAQTPATPPLDGALDEQRIAALSAAINLKDSTAILNFGSDAQQQVTAIANDMLKDVKVKDTGHAGELLTAMVSTLKGFQSSSDKLRKKPSWWKKLLGSNNQLREFLAQFDDVSEHIDAISNDLERSKSQLMVDINDLDKLYDSTLNYFHDLRHYVAAGERKLAALDSETLPALKSRAEESGSMEVTQQLRELQTQRDELERRVNDLRLTKQVTMQALPSLRMVQENDKGLVSKITTTLVNTVPLWRQQLAQSIAIYRSGKAAEASKASSDLTNELLINNARTLKTANKASREQLERGVFDIEAVEEANSLLIATIEESITMQRDASAKRQAIAERLHNAEDQLKAALRGEIETKEQ